MPPCAIWVNSICATACKLCNRPGCFCRPRQNAPKKIAIPADGISAERGFLYIHGAFQVGARRFTRTANWQYPAPGRKAKLQPMATAGNNAPFSPGPYPAAREKAVAMWLQALRSHADAATLKTLTPLSGAEAARVMALLREATPQAALPA